MGECDHIVGFNRMDRCVELQRKKSAYYQDLTKLDYLFNFCSECGDKLKEPE